MSVNETDRSFKLVIVVGTAQTITTFEIYSILANQNITYKRDISEEIKPPIGYR